MEFTHAQMRTYMYTIRRKCHMIAESEILRMSPDPFSRSGWGLGPRLMAIRGGRTSSYARTRLLQSHMTLMAFRTFFL